jgi:flagellar basal-body rod protein FlgF
MQNDQLIGLSRQKVMERQFDVIANNLANINTTGFKSSRSLFQEFLTGDARDNTFRGGDAQVHFVADGGARGRSRGPATPSILRSTATRSLR